MTTRYNPNNGTGRWYEDKPVVAIIPHVTVDTGVNVVSLILAGIVLAVIALAVI